jgi:hypothetical protein
VQGWGRVDLEIAEAAGATDEVIHLNDATLSHDLKLAPVRHLRGNTIIRRKVRCAISYQATRAG